jgi:hypothetical protein
VIGILSLLVAVAGAVEHMPVYNVNVMGGQYFFKDQRSSLSGNVQALAAPILKFNDSWSLIPTISSNYQGTKGVGDGVGSGTLYQQQMDHRLGVSALRSITGTTWKLKPTMSYKRQYLKETRNEDWGKGLFDYEKIAAGFEVENVYKEPFSWRAALDLYRIKFPNYESLESNAGVDPQGNPLGRELASKDVLDTHNVQASFSGSRPFPYDDPKVSLQAGVSSLYQRYPDQRLVNRRGSFDNSMRYDLQQALSASVGIPTKLRGARLDTSFGTSFTYNRSNQNTYDASRTTFIEDSYSYYSVGAGPAFTLSWGEVRRPTWASLSFRWNRTLFLGRLAQNADGLYLGEKQYHDRYVATLTYGYPIAPGFNLKVQSNFLWQASNQAYEKTYAYTYRTANYLMGFTWEY